MNCRPESSRSRSRALFAATLAIVSACTIAFAASAALAQPAIDGNLADFIAYGQQLKNSNTGFGVAITDKPDGVGQPQVETIYSDPKFIPCPTPQPALGSHWVNGTEIFFHYLDYVPGSNTLYLGLRTEGFVGDSDGNNNPDNSGGGACNPDDNIEDLNGISGNEQYGWRFDLNCDGIVDASIVIQDNAVVGQGLFQGVTGSFAFKQNAGTGASGHDLEVQVNLAAPLPPAFNYVRVESNAFDGLSEDRSDGQPLVGNPAIAVQKSANPPAICAGDKTRFTINIQNTGTVDLSVLATDVLPAALSFAGNVTNSCGGAVVPNGQTITFGPFNLAAGASCSISFDAQSSAECFGVVTNVVDVDGTFSSPCIKGGSQTTTAHAEATVTCKAKPCVELTSSVPPSACPGTPIEVKGTVKNCSLDPETIVIKLNGVQFFSQVVAAGATLNYSTTVPMPECTAGQQVPFNVEATATNDCPPADVKTVNQSVLCKTGPCVTAAAECNPTSACPGAPITVKGSATNCGAEAEDITITIEGQQQSFPGVASGQTVSWTYSSVMPECTSGQNVTFRVSAVATNDCGTTKPSAASCDILCIKPQIQIDKSVSPTGIVDPGTTLHYTIVVTNPSKNVPLENVHVSDELCSEVTYQDNATGNPTSEPVVGSGGTIAWDLGTIAAGGSVTVTFDALVKTQEVVDCSISRSCTNTAVATGDCAGGSGVRAEDSVTTPISCEQPGICRLTGGGCMNDDPDTGKRGHKQNTFGGNSSPLHEGGGPSGNSWEHILRDGRETLFNWHSWDAHVIECTVVPPGPCSPKAINTKAVFVGTGKYSIGSGGRSEDGNQVAYIIDHKEGSCNKDTRDEYFITVRKGLVIGEGEIVFDRGGFIDCGNLQIHETPARLFGQGAGTALPGNESGSTGITLLNRAYPNPFSGTTNFAYRVAEGGSQVEVGVYNVAGRLVKSLASGSQPAGTYTVTWNGSDDSGVRMAPGVYFLKSKVGGEQVVNRLIYVAQ